MSRFAPLAQRTARTSVGDVTIEVPDDWSSEATDESSPGEWMFSHPDDACTLYLRAHFAELEEGRDPIDRAA